MKNEKVSRLFDAYADKMDVPEEQPWIRIAMHAEGVPTGDPELDGLLEKKTEDTKP